MEKSEALIVVHLRYDVDDDDDVNDDDDLD